MKSIYFVISFSTSCSLCISFQNHQKPNQVDLSINQVYEADAFELYFVNLISLVGDVNVFELITFGKRELQFRAKSVMLRIYHYYYFAKYYPNYSSHSSRCTLEGHIKSPNLWLNASPCVENLLCYDGSPGRDKID